MLEAKDLHYVDVGVSGGVWGLERGYCHMIGGEPAVVACLDRIFRSLAPGLEAAPRTEGATGKPSQAEHGYLHCGPNCAGHFVKMVHNGIEYGLMAAYAEGLAIIRNANVGRKRGAVDAETTPLRDPQFYIYDFDLAAVAKVWRRGSVVSSWLLISSRALCAKVQISQDFRGEFQIGRRALDLEGSNRRGNASACYCNRPF